MKFFNKTYKSRVLTYKSLMAKLIALCLTQPRMNLSIDAANSHLTEAPNIIILITENRV